MKTPTTLIIMDGFGLEGPSAGNAVVNAPTPNLDRIFRDFPGCRLSASGLDVGLPEGQMGNSEVGHTNMGAGRSFRTCPTSAATSRAASSLKIPPIWKQCPTAGSGVLPFI